MISYEGIFFDEKTIKLIHSLEKQHLPIINDEIHCTFKYRPGETEIFDNLVGKEIQVQLIGYGSDGQNSGFEVQLPEEVMKYYINYDEDNPQKLKVPHITSSISEGAKVYKTKDLIFEPLPKPITITGKFGYWIKENDREYISYEPYYNNYINKPKK